MTADVFGVLKLKRDVIGSLCRTFGYEDYVLQRIVNELSVLFFAVSTREGLGHSIRLSVKDYAQVQ